MVRINLLPIREILRKRELKLFVVVAAGILVATVAVMGVVYGWFNWKISDLESIKGDRNKKLEGLKKENMEIDGLRKEITRLQTQVDNIQKLTSQRITPAPFLSALAIGMPEEAWLIDIEKSGASFRIDGLGADNTIVANLVQRLSRIKQNFSEVDPWLTPPTRPATEALARATPGAPAGVPTPQAGPPTPGGKGEKREESFFKEVKLVEMTGAVDSASGLTLMKFKIAGTTR